MNTAVRYTDWDYGPVCQGIPPGGTEVVEYGWFATNVPIYTNESTACRGWIPVPDQSHEWYVPITDSLWDCLPSRGYACR